MAVTHSPVRVDGLSAFRRAVRATDRAALKEVQAVSKRAAGIVAARGAQLAPRGDDGDRVSLHESIRGTTSGDKGIVRSRLPYAGVQEWGGVIHPRGVPIRITGSRFVGRALRDRNAEIERILADGFDAVARRNGWK